MQKRYRFYATMNYIGFLTFSALIIDNWYKPLVDVSTKQQGLSYQ